MITSLDNDFIESIIEKYGDKLIKINLSNNGKSVSFEITVISDRDDVVTDESKRANENQKLP
jgi:hypothetical protein